MKNKGFANTIAKMQAAYEKKLGIAMQIGMDAAIIAADEVFGFSEDIDKQRIVAFCVEMRTAVDEISRLLNEDDDRELIYSTATVDKRLRQIVGEEHFAPWEERYG